VNHVLVAGADFDGDDVTGKFGGECQLAAHAAGAIFGHKQRSAARHALDSAKDASASAHLRVSGHLIELVIQESSPASEITDSFGSSANSRTGMVVPTMRLCIWRLLSDELLRIWKLATVPQAVSLAAFGGAELRMAC